MVVSTTDDIIIITRRRNPVGFLPEVWSPLQATVHLCGIFYCPGIDTRVQGTTVWSPLQATVHLCGIFYCPGIDAQVQGTTVFSLIRQTLLVFTTYSVHKFFLYVLWSGSNPLTETLLGHCKSSLLTTRPAGQDMPYFRSFFTEVVLKNQNSHYMYMYPTNY
jgi:hypothetical protein